MFCATGLVFCGTEGVGSRFHILRSRTCFRRYGGRQVLFSYFALPESFPAVPRASCPVFKFCASGLIFDNIEGDRYRFQVLCSRTRFWQYRGHRVAFSCFALGLVFDGNEGVGCRFHVLVSRTRFRRYRGRRLPFSCFARPDSFSAVPRSSGLVFMYYAPGLILDGTEGVGSRFHVLRSQTHFRRYRGRPVPFSCFALLDIFSAVPRASGPVFMFCAPRLVFGDPEGNGSRFQVLRARTHFRQYPRHQVQVSSFALPDSFSAVPCASGRVFMFCAPGLVFSGTEGVGSCFHVLHARSHFRRSRGRRVLFSCFARLNSFSAVPRASGSVFLFCAPENVFCGAECVESHFHVLCAWIHFRRSRGRHVPFSCFARRD
jgi:hypothetical protein